MLDEFYRISHRKFLIAGSKLIEQTLMPLVSSIKDQPKLPKSSLVSGQCLESIILSKTI